jgi:hypothetical protein
MDTSDSSRPGKRKTVTTLVEELGYHEQRLRLEIAEGTDEVIIIDRILGTNLKSLDTVNRLGENRSCNQKKKQEN